MTSVETSSGSRYSPFVYFILVAVTFETLFLCYNTQTTTWQNNELRRRIDKMETRLGLAVKQLNDIRDNRKYGDILHKKQAKHFEKKTDIRIRRGIEEKGKSILNEVRYLLFKLIDEREFLKEERCRNVTLVCRKGERGPKGKHGPRGIKGARGDKGDVGPRGQKGPVGAIGPKGQKGVPGTPGKSIGKPKFPTKFQKTIMKAVSMNLSLICEAKGNPQPEISWNFGSRKIDSRYSYPVKGALSITNIDKNDQGIIQCIAENILGKEIMETELIVHTKPQVLLQHKRLTATAGIPFVIQCGATGNPLPKMEWKKGFGSLSAQQTLSKDGKSLSMRFEKVSYVDAGWYTCEAENYVGISTDSMSLDVIGQDCSYYNGMGGNSGVYTINPDGKESFNVFCDMTTNGGGWTVIQRRADGSVDFYKNWIDYKLGFGHIENEFWLGNDKIHRLTKQKNMKIRFDLEDVDGKKAFAEYKMFYIDGEDLNYKLHVGVYSGTAGDSFNIANGTPFSTKDRDNDVHTANCAKLYSGAWWYTSCHESNLNGKYLNGPHKSYANGVIWYKYRGHYNSLKRTEMKVRPLN